jgi:uncharacterized membrane protein AbrB (regulator of aidB expression)
MPKKKSSSEKYLKYSGLAMQLFGLNLIAVLVGRWADAKLGLEKGYISMLLILLFNVGFFYGLYLDLNKSSEEDE